MIISVNLCKIFPKAKNCLQKIFWSYKSVIYNIEYLFVIFHQYPSPFALSLIYMIIVFIAILKMRTFFVKILTIFDLKATVSNYHKFIVWTFFFFSSVWKYYLWFQWQYSTHFRSENPSFMAGSRYTKRYGFEKQVFFFQKRKKFFVQTRAISIFWYRK